MNMRPPKTWLLLGHKAGDNSQVIALADALGWPYDIKHMVYRNTELVTNLFLGPNLAGILKSDSSPLTAPWPELIITAGRRNEPIARWIKKQAGEKTRLVHIGRPWAKLIYFDLIVTTPQYRLPPHSNVIYNALALHQATSHRLTEAATLWQPRLAHLPRPYIALMIGGHSGPYRFNEQKAAHLGRQANAMALKQNGALLITTSARTPSEAAEALLAEIKCPAYIFKWGAQVDNNPYFAYLALADSFIVTSDSISMLTETCYTEKPVHIFDLKKEPSTTTRNKNTKLVNMLQFFSIKHIAHYLLMRIGPQRMRRNLRVMQKRLIKAGYATWLGQSLPTDQEAPPSDDMKRTVARVKGLFTAD